MCHSMIGLTRCYKTAVFYILANTTASWPRLKSLLHWHAVITQQKVCSSVRW